MLYYVEESKRAKSNQKGEIRQKKTKSNLSPLTDKTWGLILKNKIHLVITPNEYVTCVFNSTIDLFHGSHIEMK